MSQQMLESVRNEQVSGLKKQFFFMGEISNKFFWRRNVFRQYSQERRQRCSPAFASCVTSTTMAHRNAEALS
jgi:hypothetical protein